jgi:hypothetical protein
MLFPNLTVSKLPHHRMKKELERRQRPCQAPQHAFPQAALHNRHHRNPDSRFELFHSALDPAQISLQF